MRYNNSSSPRGDTTARAMNDPNPPDTLLVVGQPVSEFYKDEGGKGNHLVVLIGVRRNAQIAVPGPHERIALKASLYFESELRVEESDQSILNIVGNKFQAPTIDPKTGQVAIKFRLEKVRVGQGVERSLRCGCVRQSGE